MNKETIFWIVMLFWVLACGWDFYQTKKPSFPNIVAFILFLVLGWQVFGQPIK